MHRSVLRPVRIIGGGRSIISGLCRGLKNFRRGDIYIYITRVDRRVCRALSIQTENTTSCYLVSPHSQSPRYTSHMQRLPQRSRPGATSWHLLQPRTHPTSHMNPIRERRSFGKVALSRFSTPITRRIAPLDANGGNRSSSITCVRRSDDCALWNVACNKWPIRPANEFYNVKVVANPKNGRGTPFSRENCHVRDNLTFCPLYETYRLLSIAPPKKELHSRGKGRKVIVLGHHPADREYLPGEG